MRPIKYILTMSLVAFIVIGCARSDFKGKPLPFKKPSDYNNAAQVGEELDIGAEVYSNSKRAKKSFGFDIKKAGLTPVLIVFENRSPYNYRILGDQTFLKDRHGVLWKLLEEHEVYDTLASYSMQSNNFRVNYNPDEMLVEGASGGPGIGMIIGKVMRESAEEDENETARQKARRVITQELVDGNLESSPVPPESFAHGVLFFSGDVQSPRSLHLRLEEVDTGDIHNVVLSFE